MLTAISVARQCGMVPGKEAVILVNALPPEPGDPGVPAQIEWEYADIDKPDPAQHESDVDEEEPVQDDQQVGIGLFCEMLDPHSGSNCNTERHSASGVPRKIRLLSFLGRTRRSRDGFMESCTCRRHCHRGPPPPAHPPNMT